jgi:hypothetical protein
MCVQSVKQKEIWIMSKRFSRLAILTAVLGSFLAIPAAPALAQGGTNNITNRLEVPVTGVVEGKEKQTLAGTVSISRFAIQDEKLVAIGQLTGTVSDKHGNPLRTIVTSVVMPVTNATGGAADAASCDSDATAQAACNILNLVLGPLHLDLLGLVIDLNRVVLNITAEPGPGNLLGNLLCAITGLLDAGSLGQQIVDLLNQLIGILAGL